MTLKEYNSRKNNESNGGFLVSYLTKTLICAIFVFVMLILVNVSDNIKDFMKEKVLTTNLNFASINSFYNKYFTNIFRSNELPVNNEFIEESYEEYENGVKVINESENVTLRNSGIVIYIGEKEEYGKTIIVQQSDGIDAWYGVLNSVDVKLYDYIDKGTILGGKEEYYYLLFQKEGEFLNYEDVIK